MLLNVVSNQYLSDATKCSVYQMLLNVWYLIRVCQMLLNVVSDALHCHMKHNNNW